MKIVEKKIDDLKPYENNPRHNDNAVGAVAESIKEFGFKVPIIIDSAGVIVAGHTRHKAAQRLGLKKVPCIIADDLTPEQIKAFRLADNKVGELATWDTDLEFLELSELDKIGFNMELFGFQPIQNDDRNEVVEDVPPEPEQHRPPTTTPGDVWQLGRHRLICGDSTDAETLRELMDGTEADLILTDPPYNVDYSAKNEMLNRADKGNRNARAIENDKMTDGNFYAFLLDVYKNLFSVAKDGAAVYICHADMESVNFINAFKAAGFHLAERLIWNKNILVIGRNDYHWKHEPILYGWKPGAAHYFTDSRAETTVVEDRPDVNKMSKTELKAYIKQLLDQGPPATVINADKPLRNAEHPTMKPVKLMAYFIRNSSRPGESVLDVFGGSGSTLIAAEQTGRRCFTCELDPRYCDVIVKRWENLTGEKAVRV